MTTNNNYRHHQIDSIYIRQQGSNKDFILHTHLFFIRLYYYTTMNKYLSLTLAFAALSSGDAFTSTADLSTRQACPTSPLMAVIDINEEGSFDNTIKNAGSSLVVVDYSTTW